MMLSLLLALALQNPPHVEGLREGERFRTLPSSEEVDPETVRSGRVVDATSGRPIAGVQVTTWTEEISGPARGLRRIGEARTGDDGCFRVAIVADGIRAEKMLARAPGYLTAPGTAGDLERIELMPKPQWSTRLRVVDLLDRPIAGARITSTYSCAHDVPAFDVRTGADGVAELPEFGLQDRTPDLRVRAAGFAARKYVDWTEAPPLPSSRVPPTIRLARQPATHARVLDRGGKPLAGRALYVIDGDGYHVPRTDAEGVFEIESGYDDGVVFVYPIEEQGGAPVFCGPLPTVDTDELLTVRVRGEERPDDLPSGTVRVDLGDLEGVGARLEHADGWWESRVPEDGLAFPAGRVRVVVGRAFSGWEPEFVDLELAAGEERVVQLAPRREPELEILAPPDAYRIVVQAGARSRELPGEERQVCTVPAGEELVVLCEGTRTRRLALPPAPGTRVVDLRGDDCVLPPNHAQLAEEAPRAILRVRVLTHTEGELTAVGIGPPSVTRAASESPGEELYDVAAPAGFPVLVRWSAPGFAPCSVAAIPEQRGFNLVPRPLASLELVDETAAGVTVESLDPECLDALDAGPLSLQLRFGDGRRGLVSLELSPGERRTLRIRD